jgi:hypothetical protein
MTTPVGTLLDEVSHDLARHLGGDVATTVERGFAAGSRLASRPCPTHPET